MRGEIAIQPISTRRVWRRATEVKAPLLALSSALDVEYEDPAVHREAPGDDASAQPAPGVVIIDVHGPLEHHEHPFFASFENVTRITCDVLDRADVRAVVLRIDSPGGVANGMSQASQQIRSHATRLGKPLYVYADEQICSAAYGLACAADEIWGPPTAEVGSVGVILPVCDATQAHEQQGLRVELLTTGARKGDGDPSKPLTDDVRAALQERVDAIGEDFFALVSTRRGMSIEAVRSLEAGVFVGAAAVERGLMDGVATFAQFVAMVADSVSGRIQRGEAAEGNDMATKTRLALVKAYQAAEQTLRASTTPATIAAATEALAKIGAELVALDGVKASVGAGVKTGAKSSYYKETTKIEERVEDDEEKKDAEDEPESEEAPPSSKPAGEDMDAEDSEDKDDDEPESKRGAVEDAEDMDSEDAEDAEDSEDMDSEDDEKPKGKKMKKAAKAEKDVPKKYPGASAKGATILAHVRALTGSADRATMLGKLDALAEKAARYDAIVAKRAQADQSKRNEALISEAIRAGKVGPKNAKMLTQLRAMEPKRLRAFVDAMPAVVRRVDEGAIPAAVAADGSVAKVDTLSKQAREVISTIARTTGKSLEQATADYVDAYHRAAGR